jgi:6-pyruvoyltetrahydropterin/6-carboxytetrahydropterin synthase
MIISVKHNFETAHRLPFIPGKCQNIHGHSWWATFKIGGPRNDEGITIEYGKLKKVLRNWIDGELDHGAMLGVEDNLFLPLAEEESKVFVFGTGSGLWDVPDLKWPTVENVSIMLARIGQHLVNSIDERFVVIQVDVQETHINSATWRIDDTAS